jgi:hypothetical protein
MLWYAVIVKWMLNELNNIAINIWVYWLISSKVVLYGLILIYLLVMVCLIFFLFLLNLDII